MRTDTHIRRVAGADCKVCERPADECHDKTEGHKHQTGVVLVRGNWICVECARRAASEWAACSRMAMGADA